MASNWFWVFTSALPPPPNHDVAMVLIFSISLGFVVQTQCIPIKAGSTEHPILNNDRGVVGGTAKRTEHNLDARGDGLEALLPLINTGTGGIRTDVHATRGTRLSISNALKVVDVVNVVDLELQEGVGDRAASKVNGDLARVALAAGAEADADVGVGGHPAVPLEDAASAAPGVLKETPAVVNLARLGGTSEAALLDLHARTLVNADANLDVLDGEARARKAAAGRGTGKAKGVGNTGGQGASGSA